MGFDSELQFSLKLHTIQNIILAKQQEVLSLQSRLQSISAIQAQSQDQILSLISEVHKTIKGVEKIIVQVKEPCSEIKMLPLYQLFRNICCVAIGSVRLLAQGCQYGVQRNLLKFTSKNAQNSQIFKTVCLEQSNQSMKAVETKLNNCKYDELLNFDETQVQIEIDQIYRSLSVQKDSVMKTAASSTVSKLNQVKMCWMKMMSSSDQMLEQAYYRKNQDRQKSLDRPDYISKVLKEELTNSIKLYFKQAIEKVLKKFYKDFYIKQYTKIKQKIEKQKPQTRDNDQQTEIKGIYELKHILKQKKHYEKIMKQNKDIIEQRNNLVEQYSKATKNNYIYVERINELEKKVFKLMSSSSGGWQRRFYQSRQPFRGSKRNSARQSKDKQPVDTFFLKTQKAEQLGQKNLKNTSNISNHESKTRLSIRYQQNQNEVQILKKRITTKGQNLKSRLYLLRNTNKNNKQNIQVIKNQQNQHISSTQVDNNTASFNFGETDGVIANQIQRLMRLISQDQYRNTIIQVLQAAETIKNKQNTQMQKQVKINNNNPNIAEKQNNKLNQKQVNKNIQNNEIANIMVQNCQVSNIIQNLLKKIIINGVVNATTTENKQQIELNQDKSYINGNQNIIAKNYVTKLQESQHNACQNRLNEGYPLINKEKYFSSTLNQQKYRQKNQYQDEVYTDLRQKFVKLSNALQNKNNIDKNFEKQGNVNKGKKNIINCQNYQRFQTLNISTVYSPSINVKQISSCSSKFKKTTLGNFARPINKKSGPAIDEHTLINIKQINLDTQFNKNWQQFIRSIVQICQRFIKNGGSLEQMISQYINGGCQTWRNRRMATTTSRNHGHNSLRYRISRLDTQ